MVKEYHMYVALGPVYSMNKIEITILRKMHGIVMLAKSIRH